jgi:formamidopyrimidine-DNA glycosylase
MPELPEVQTIVNDLNAAGVVGHAIETTRVRWSRTLANRSPASFSRSVRGAKIVSIRRRAKYIVIQLDCGMHLIIHLRMTGKILMDHPADAQKRHIHIEMTLDDGRGIFFHDTRKFGRFYLVRNPEEILRNLGPEPLSDDFHAIHLKRMIHKRKRRIKPLLLDQSFLAGLGNIYVDEALWSARIHPQKTADQLSYKEIKALHRAIRHVLRKGLRNQGSSLGSGKTNFASVRQNKGSNSNHLNVFRRTGKPCRRCRTSILRIVIAQRATHICNVCQA